jgi:hypothetical protein
MTAAWQQLEKIPANRTLTPAREGYQRVILGKDPIGLPSIPPKATSALLTAEMAPVRYEDDGNDPTATSRLIVVGVPVLLSGELNQIRVVGTAKGAVLKVRYYL